MSVSFFVAGIPSGQGSARAFVVGGKARITSTNRSLQDWRSAIRLVAQDHFDAVITGPVKVELMFVLPRPKATPKKNVRPWAAKKPDLDKLVRAGLDALKGVCYPDDAAVCQIFAAKAVAAEVEQTGVHIVVMALTGDTEVQE